MTDVALEDLPFDELRQRAFKRAEHHADVGFFTDLFSHMPGMVAIEGEGGDLGAVGGTIIESVRAWREMVGDKHARRDDGDAAAGPLRHVSPRARRGVSAASPAAVLPGAREHGEE